MEELDETLLKQVIETVLDYGGYVLRLDTFHLCQRRFQQFLWASITWLRLDNLKDLQWRQQRVRMDVLNHQDYTPSLSTCRVLLTVLEDLHLTVAVGRVRQLRE